jgi:hypothetical protein
MRADRRLFIAVCHFLIRLEVDNDPGSMRRMPLIKCPYTFEYAIFALMFTFLHLPGLLPFHTTDVLDSI